MPSQETKSSGKLLTVYCGEYERHRHQSLAHAIVERAREEGLAGATMVRGIEGFGASGRLHTARFVSASDDLPIVVQIVDRADRIDSFLTIVDEMVADGLVTVEDIDIISHHRHQSLPFDDEAFPG